ncbi:MAG: PQQ-binding-like beta-propeller repeat protein [Pseudomonadota bacterium]
MIYAGSRGEIVALDERTGRVHWTFSLSGGMLGHLKSADMSLIDHNGLLFIGANGYVICLDAQNGFEMWRHDIKGAYQDWVALSVAGKATNAAAALLRSRSSSGSGDGDGGGGGD